MNRVLTILAIALLIWFPAAGQTRVEIKHDTKPVEALQWGTGKHVVIVIHGYGGSPPLFGTAMGGELGPKLATAGFRVVAPGWAGFPSGGDSEISAVAAWVRQSGATKVSLVGHSYGADLAARLATGNPDGTFDTIVLLAITDGKPIALMNTKKLFVVSEGDTVSKRAQVLAEQSSQPKRVVLLQGTGHSIFTLSNEQFVLPEAIIEMLNRGQ